MFLLGVNGTDCFLQLSDDQWRENAALSQEGVKKYSNQTFLHLIRELCISMRVEVCYFQRKHPQSNYIESFDICCRFQTDCTVRHRKLASKQIQKFRCIGLIQPTLITCQLHAQWCFYRSNNIYSYTLSSLIKQDITC